MRINAFSDVCLRIAMLLAAPPLLPGEEPDSARRFLRAARDRLAEGWHVIVILWLLAAWTIWALQIQGGFERLISASVATIVLIALVIGEGDQVNTRALRQVAQHVKAADLVAAIGWKRHAVSEEQDVHQPSPRAIIGPTRLATPSGRRCQAAT